MADASTPIVRLGTGSLGGKGRGFRFLHNLSDKFNMSTVIPDVELVVPRCFVLATSTFEDFMDDNELMKPALNASDDDELLGLYENAEFRPAVLSAMRTFLKNQTGPLAVRSSSLFEDAFMQPFAGIYKTVFLPNSEDSLDERLSQLSWAVKQVGAAPSALVALHARAPRPHRPSSFKEPPLLPTASAPTRLRSPPRHGSTPRPSLTFNLLYASTFSNLRSPPRHRSTPRPSRPRRGPTPRRRRTAPRRRRWLSSSSPSSAPPRTTTSTPPSPASPTRSTSTRCPTRTPAVAPVPPPPTPPPPPLATHAPPTSPPTRPHPPQPLARSTDCSRSPLVVGSSAAHGCAQVGLGLGASVVDGAPAVHFSLGDPSVLTGPELDTLPVTALDLSAQPRDGGAHLVQLSGLASHVLETVPRASAAVMAPEASRQLAASLTQDVHGEQVVFKRGFGDVVDDGATPTGTPDAAAGLQSVPLKQMLSGEVSVGPDARAAPAPPGHCPPVRPAPPLARHSPVGCARARAQVPLAKALSFLLRLGQAGLGCPVEIEFALKARKDAAERHQLHLLQIRPQATYVQRASDRFQFLPSADYAAVASTRALGHGRFEGITDVVYVSPERFDKGNTAAIAAEISKVNAALQKEGRKYLLMAPGRWGSADAASGIPVAWQDIDNSAFIVETVLDDATPVSQGSHFFQNIISFGLGYMTVDPSKQPSAEVAEYSFWDAQPAVASSTGDFVRHVRLDAPLEIVVDGQSRHGVVMKPGKPFDVYVGQVDAFMVLAQEQFNSSS